MQLFVTFYFGKLGRAIEVLDTDAVASADIGPEHILVNHFLVGRGPEVHSLASTAWGPKFDALDAFYF